MNHKSIAIPVTMVKYPIPVAPIIIAIIIPSIIGIIVTASNIPINTIPMSSNKLIVSLSANYIKSPFIFFKLQQSYGL